MPNHRPRCGASIAKRTPSSAMTDAWLDRKRRRAQMFRSEMERRDYLARSERRRSLAPGLCNDNQTCCNFLCRYVHESKDWDVANEIRHIGYTGGYHAVPPPRGPGADGSLEVDTGAAELKKQTVLGVEPGCEGGGCGCGKNATEIAEKMEEALAAAKAVNSSSAPPSPPPG